MKQAMAMVWKEWRELRIYLIIGLGIFVGLPVVAGIEASLQYAHRFEMQTYYWVFMLGGVLAVFTAVGATCRDFQGHLEDFWRSRPVGPVRWLLTKYFVGLLIVLASCMIPLALELAVSPIDDCLPLLKWFPFLWAALYSLGFLAGCVIRRTAQAAMLALSGMLLVYFLPLVLPPLSWLNVTEITGATSYWNYGALPFAGGLLCLAVVSLRFALAAVRHDWWIESGQKMLYWSVAVAVLILFTSAGYQVGTNLPVLQEAGFRGSQDEYAILLRCNGQSGYLVTGKYTKDAEYTMRRFQITAAGIETGSNASADSYFRDISIVGAANPEHPDIEYYVNSDKNSQSFLNIIDVDGGTIKTMHIEDYDPKVDPWPRAVAWENRLYLLGRHLITLDITDPMSPRYLSDEPYGLIHSVEMGVDEFSLSLPLLPGVPPQERINAALKTVTIRPFTLQGDILYSADEFTIYAYRMTGLSGTWATFKKIGEYRETMLQSFLGSRGITGLAGKDGLVYVVTGYVGYLNPQIIVFDARSSQPLRQVAHFAAPGVEIVCPLPNGRALVGGTQLWLVGPPPR